MIIGEDMIREIEVMIAEIDHLKEQESSTTLHQDQTQIKLHLGSKELFKNNFFLNVLFIANLSIK